MSMALEVFLAGAPEPEALLSALSARPGFERTGDEALGHGAIAVADIPDPFETEAVEAAHGIRPDGMLRFTLQSKEAEGVELDLVREALLLATGLGAEAVLRYAAGATLAVLSDGRIRLDASIPQWRDALGPAIGLPVDASELAPV